MILYHYTQLENLSSILEDGVLYPSSPWTATDAYAGDGWYFTSASPEECEVIIAHVCWQQAIPERVEAYLKFDISEGLLQNTRNLVYMLPQKTIPSGKLSLSGHSNNRGQRVIVLLENGEVEEQDLDECGDCQFYGANGCKLLD